MDALTVIAEPTRRQILELLANSGGLAAGDIHGRFTSTPPAISQHLKVLKNANLVLVERRAQQRIYYVNPEPVKDLERWITRFSARVEEQYRSLDKVLAAEKAKLQNKENE